MKETKQYFVMISAGGTGGHVSPAAALAKDLTARGHRVELITDPRGMRYIKMFDGIPVHEVKSGTSGAGITGKVKGAINLASGIISALSLVKKKKPDAVVGFGGYPSVPGVLAAQMKGIPTILHEQNAIIGKANMFLAPKARAIALSLPLIKDLEHTDSRNIILTGNPVRQDILSLAGESYAPVKKDEDLNILIMGGSLGATVLSKVIPSALSSLAQGYKARLNVVQQCRESDIEDVRAVYENAGIKAHLTTFIDDVVGEYKKAHLFIGRSGASTVAEVAVAGLPAIYVPLNVHKDQQQKHNANVIADQGGAWIMTEDGFTPDALLARIETMFQTPDILEKAAENAKKCGKADATKKLTDLVISTIED